MRWRTNISVEPWDDGGAIGQSTYISADIGNTIKISEHVERSEKENKY